MSKFKMWPVLAAGFLMLAASSTALANWSSDWRNVWKHVVNYDNDDDEDDRTSSVEGRTYCSVLTQTILRADSSGTPPFDRDGIAIQVIRRTFTFLEGGTTFEGVLDGARVQNNLSVVPGIVSLFDPGASPSPIVGTYVQTGQKLDMNITTIGIQPTWYVSKDGSVIHGTRIDQAVNTNPIGISTLVTRDWTLVENNTCDAEGA